MSFVENTIARTILRFVESEEPASKRMFKLFVAEVCNRISVFDRLYDRLADEESKRILEWAISFRFMTYLTNSREVAHRLVPSRITPVKWDKMLVDARSRPEAEYEKNLDVDLVENFVLDGYNLPGICEVSDGDCVLDLGGFNGNSAIALARRCPKGRVYAFEPNPTMQEILLRNVEKSGEKNISLVRSGVSHSDSTLKFKRDGAASRVDPNGDISVGVVAIDNWVVANNITQVDFMKFDIEGFERHAVRGAAKTITRYRPKIAISIYHIFDDYVILPKLIEDLGWYELYLRHNAITGGEMVLFCKPV